MLFKHLCDERNHFTDVLKVAYNYYRTGTSLNHTSLVVFLTICANDSLKFYTCCTSSANVETAQVTRPHVYGGLHLLDCILHVLQKW